MSTHPPSFVITATSPRVLNAIFRGRPSVSMIWTTVFVARSMTATRPALGMLT